MMKVRASVLAYITFITTITYIAYFFNLSTNRESNESFFGIL